MIRTNRMALVAVVGVSLLVCGLAPALADEFTNNVVSTGDLVRTMTAGGSTTVVYTLEANEAPPGDPNGCDASSTSPVNVTISPPVPTRLDVVQVTGPNRPNLKGPLPFVFQVFGCAATDAVTVTFYSDTVGSYPIKHTIGGGIPFSRLENSADFTLTVTSPTPNTAPTLALPAVAPVEATGTSGATVAYDATASDAEDGSLTPTCTPPSDSTFPLGITEVGCSVTDRGGLTTSGSFPVTVQDTVPPKLTLPADISTTATSNSGAVVPYTASATDLVDGSVSVTCSPASGSTFTAGPTTVNCSATDKAGNRSTGSFAITVSVASSVAWSGFFQPVDNLPTVNTVKAGSAIPVKFSLTGNQGLNIFQTGSPSSGTYACNGTAATDAIETTVTAGGSSLSYDAVTDQYTYVWKTDKTWANTCRTLFVRLSDGSTATANFSFSR
jgi:hypothetical protein